MKVHYFCLTFSQIFCREGTVPSPDPTSYPFAPYSKILDLPLIICYCILPVRPVCEHVAAVGRTFWWNHGYHRPICECDQVWLNHSKQDNRSMVYMLAVYIA